MLSDHKRAERREVLPGRVKMSLFGCACVACNDRSGFTWIVMIAVRGLEGIESMEAPSSSPPLFIYLESQSFPEKLNHGGKEAHLALPIPPVISPATSSTPQLLIPLHRNRACIHNDVNKHLSHRHLLEPSWGHRSMFCYPSQ